MTINYLYQLKLWSTYKKYFFIYLAMQRLYMKYVGSKIKQFVSMYYKKRKIESIIKIKIIYYWNLVI